MARIGNDDLIGRGWIRIRSHGDIIICILISRGGSGLNYIVRLGLVLWVPPLVDDSALLIHS